MNNCPGLLQQLQHALRRHGLRTAHFAASDKARSLRRASSPHATRFAGLARGPRYAPGRDSVKGAGSGSIHPFSQRLLQQLQDALGHLVGLSLVVTSSVSLASPQAVKLAHFAAPPLPTEPASLGFGGDPGQAAMLSQAGQMLRHIQPALTAAAAGRPGAPGSPEPAWPERTGSGCCSWCRPSSRRPRRCRGWWTRRPGCSPP